MADASIHDLLFSPLSRKWCDVYYFSTVFFFLWFVSVVFFVLQGVMNGKMPLNLMTILLIFNAFLPYFLGRLTYSVCTASLR